VEPSRLIAFCNAVNAGDEPRKTEGGAFLLRDADWEKEANDRPDVPAEVRDYILAKPIEATIVKVMGYKKSVRIVGRPVLEEGYSIVIDRGRNDRVRVGMRFFSDGEPDRLIGFVASVDEKTSTLIASWLSRGNERIKAGVSLSTKW
jgi:hypothetical protein